MQLVGWRDSQALACADQRSRNASVTIFGSHGYPVAVNLAPILYSLLRVNHARNELGAGTRPFRMFHVSSEWTVSDMLAMLDLCPGLVDIAISHRNGLPYVLSLDLKDDWHRYGYTLLNLLDGASVTCDVSVAERG